MSRNARIGLIVAAVVIAVGAFVIARNGNDDNGKSTATVTTKTTASGKTETVPAAAKPTVVTLKNHAPVGGKQKISATKGEQVRFTVVSDKGDQIHLHGYDVEKEAKPGKPAAFSFKANIEGVFEIESHTAEHLGLPAVVAQLVVNPS